MARRQCTLVLGLSVLVSLCSLGNADIQIIKPFVKHNKESIRSFVLADWGGLPDFPYRTAIEAAVAAQLGKLASNVKVEHIFALGDNFYYDGVQDVDDTRFKLTFEDVFTAESLQNIPWHVIAGNHDWNGNISAQISYTNVSKRWEYPNYYYNVYLGIDGVNYNLVQVVMIDTILLCGNTDDFKSDNDTLIKVASGQESEVQWKWIERQLAQSNGSRYLLVAGHYPVWSVGEHGPTKCLVDRLLPMLYKYKVSAYLCGHDHSLQHISVSAPVLSGGGNWTVEYLLTGAANFMDASVLHQNSVPSNSLKFHWADYMSLGGFGYMEASVDVLRFSFVDTKGRLLHKVNIKPRS